MAERYGKLIRILSLAAVAANAIFVAWFFYLEIASNGDMADLNGLAKVDIKDQSGPVSPVNSSGRPLKLLFFGDLMLDRHVGERIAAHGFDYLLADLAAVDRATSSASQADFFQGYDIVSANLEGAVTADGAHYPPVMSYDFAFSPNLISQLKNYYFNFFNIANNHLADQGERGIIETRQNLTKLGLAFSGCYDGRTGDCSGTNLTLKGKTVSFAGFSLVYRQVGLDQATAVVSGLASSSDLVIVNIHWGVEYQHQFNQTQQQLAHQLIEAGADVIIGHHPHVVQGIEIYRGRPVFYSLGNFIFDQYFSAATQQGLAVSLVYGNQSMDFVLYPIESRSSSQSLMAGAAAADFLNQLVSWSDIAEEYQQQLKEGYLSLAR